MNLNDAQREIRDELVDDFRKLGSITAVARKIGMHREVLKQRATDLGIDIPSVIGKGRRGRTAAIYTKTVSGAQFYLSKPTADMIEIEDIAHALSQICRFNGHTAWFSSVARHSVNVALTVLLRSGDPRIALVALLHDAHEAYIGDMSTPLKLLVGPRYGRIADKIDAAVAEAFGLQDVWASAMKDFVKDADRYWLYVEALEARIDGAVLIDGEYVPSVRDWVPDDFIHDEELGPDDMEQAKRSFLGTFYRLMDAISIRESA